MAGRFEIKDEHLKWLFLVPGSALLLAFSIIPFIWSFGISFYDYSSAVFGKAPDFAGFVNYLWIITHPDVWVRFQNTARFAVTAVSLEFLVGMSLAILLSERFRGRMLVVTLAILPMMVAPEMVAAILFKSLMYDRTVGFMTYLVKALGLQINWMAEDAFLAVISVDVWTWSPFVMLIALGGLSSVPRDVTESAEIDGAGWWQWFRYIALPYARPFFLLAALFRFADALRTWEVIREWTEMPPPLGANPLTIDMLPSYLFNIGFRAFKTSEAAALASVILLMGLVLTYTYLRYLWRIERG